MQLTHNFVFKKRTWKSERSWNGHVFIGFALWWSLTMLPIRSWLQAGLRISNTCDLGHRVLPMGHHAAGAVVTSGTILTSDEDRLSEDTKGENRREPQTVANSMWIHVNHLNSILYSQCMLYADDVWKVPVLSSNVISSPTALAISSGGACNVILSNCFNGLSISVTLPACHWVLITVWDKWEFAVRNLCSWHSSVMIDVMIIETSYDRMSVQSADLEVVSQCFTLLLV